MLTGPHVELRALQTEDALLMYKWHNDPRVTADMGPRDGLLATSMEEERAALQRAVGSATERHFIIHARDGGRAIGYAILGRIDQRRASAQLTVVIGEPEEWDKGYGREAAGLLVGYAFRVLNLHRVWAAVPDHNERALACLAAAGLEREGTLRDDHFHRGAYRSSHLLSVLRPEGRG